MDYAIAILAGALVFSALHAAVRRRHISQRVTDARVFLDAIQNDLTAFDEKFNFAVERLNAVAHNQHEWNKLATSQLLKVNTTNDGMQVEMDRQEDRINAFARTADGLHAEIDKLEWSIQGLVPKARIPKRLLKKKASK